MLKEIEALLDGAELDAKGDLNISSVSDNAFALDEAWHAKHKKWIQTFQGIEVVLEALHALRQLVSPRGIPQRLVDAVGPMRVQAAKEELLNFMESVPRKYDLFFPIRSRAKFTDSKLQLGRRLILCGRPRINSAPDPGTNNALAGLGALLGPKTSIVMTFKVAASGYITSSSEDSGVALACATLRQFIGMGIATKVIDYEFPIEQTFARQFEVLDRISKKSILIDLPAQLQSYLSRVAIVDHCLESSADLGGVIVVSSAFKPKMTAIASAMEANAKNGRHIRTASEWLFDSESETNETTALLFASIGLEAALDSPGKETTARLGDRLAWSLGGSLSQRNEMAQQYERFYRVRCDLAHGRERQLDENGKRQLAWGKEMLRRIIAKELERSLN